MLTTLTGLSTDEIYANFESLRRHGLVVSQTFMTGIPRNGLFDNLLGLTPSADAKRVNCYTGYETKK